MAEDQAQAVAPQRFRPPDSILIAIVLFLLFVILSLFGLAISAETPAFSKAWAKYEANHVALAPLATALSGLATLVLGAFVAWVGLGQLKTARLRHEEQTRADLQQRITESFTAAVEQLGHAEPQVRIGGIYALERISRESDADYWPVIETLAAFIRQRAPLRDNGIVLGYRVPTDLAVALAVVGRRGERNRKREESERWQVDLHSTNLENADVRLMRFERTDLCGASLSQASLFGAHFEEAWFIGANLRGADLSGARLAYANFHGANLEQAELRGALVQGAKLGDAKGLTQAQIDLAEGDAETTLPKGLTHPAHWTKPK